MTTNLNRVENVKITLHKTSANTWTDATTRTNMAKQTIGE